MIVLEKWNPKKPITAIYWDGAKERYYGKRFLIDAPDKEETFISDHDNSQLELVSTDWRPVSEMIFYKERGKDQRENEQVSMEDFISIKGISAMGNQFYTEKLKGLNWIDSLPYEEPVVEEVVQEESTPVEDANNNMEESSSSNQSKDENKDSLDDDEGQITLF